MAGTVGRGYALDVLLFAPGISGKQSGNDTIFASCGWRSDIAAYGNDRNDIEDEGRSDGFDVRRCGTAVVALDALVARKSVAKEAATWKLIPGDKSK